MTTEAQRLIEWIEGDMSCTGDKEIVAELRRLVADKDDWKDASFVFKDRALKAEEEAKRLANINSELYATHNKRLVREARSEERTAELEAANAELLEALKSTGLFLHHCWCDVAMNDYSFEKLKQQMEVTDAAIKKHGGEA